jgi:NodT family efflux transporter outer membrane factor (OMF) lipoprotein
MMRRISVYVALVLAAGCSVGPDYVRPEIETPAAYKELDGWKTAQPSDSIDRGDWWTMFGDPTLDELEKEADAANQNVLAAYASYAQARALVAAARASYYPTISLGVGAAKGRISGTLSNSRFATRQSTSDYVLPLDATWEIDLWGRVRRAVESSEANEQASAADLETARLSLEAELASDYFQLRGEDAQIDLLLSSIDAYEKSFEVTQNRYQAGVAGRGDVAQAQTLLESTRAQEIDAAVLRAELEHAIAVLTGQPPANLTLPAAPLQATPPSVPIGVPSQLLERRPDVVEAEQLLVAANARIGEALANFFPRIGLTTLWGGASSDLGDLLDHGFGFWSLIGDATGPLFTFGRTWYNWRGSQADTEAALHDYEQTVLVALQEVSNSLVAREKLALVRVEQERTVNALTESLSVARTRYVGGLSTYIEVLDAQQQLFPAENALAQTRRDELIALVDLYRALGGGWSQEPPPPDLPHPFVP